MESLLENQPQKSKLTRAKILTKHCYDPKTYEFDESFRAYNPEDPLTVHTTFEMLECLSKRPDIELDAKVIGHHPEEGLKTQRVDRGLFLESFGRTSPWDKVKFREIDQFAAPFTPGFTQGNDFTPLLGGPFFKNLYYYQDYIRMHSEAFFAYHHDPIAKAITQITRDFVIGNGYEVQCDQKDPRGQLGMAAWKAYEEVNDLQLQMDQACEESSVYGEVMWWKLPNNQAKVIYQLKPGDTIPYGIIPRCRLIDPSNIVEIVTYPEDITRPLFYVWLVPTQWQMFQSGLGEGRPTDLSHIQPSLKFIYRTVMADQMAHFKINCVSNEKRGRSDYFPILSYLKRLRDIVDYQLIALQKASAWAIDTEIDGDQSDIDNYISDQASLGTIPPGGSEFVHSTKIKREYRANQGSSQINSDAFSLALSMCASGVGIPVSYFGTHLSGGQTRASALVATEPVAKKMEKRREIMKRMIKMHWKFCMVQAGLPDLDCDIIFPEIITQDRSMKLRDLALAETSRWLSPARVAAMAAKEFQIHGYDYQSELEDMKKELPQVPQPLSDPPGGENPAWGAPQPGMGMGGSFGHALSDTANVSQIGVSGLTSEDRKEIKYDGTHL